MKDVVQDSCPLAALEWLRTRKWDDRVMATSLDVQNIVTRESFVGGKVVMVEDGSWALKDIVGYANFKIGVALFPAGPVRQFTLAITDGLGIYLGTKFPEEAQELMKFLISKNYGNAMARTNFLRPARASLVNDLAALIREEFPEKAKGVEVSAFADGHLNGYSVTTEVSVNINDAKRIAYDAWARVFTLGQASTESIQTACLLI